MNEPENIIKQKNPEPIRHSDSCFECRNCAKKFDKIQGYYCHYNRTHGNNQGGHYGAKYKKRKQIQSPLPLIKKQINNEILLKKYKFQFCPACGTDMFHLLKTVF